MHRCPHPLSLTAAFVASAVAQAQTCLTELLSTNPAGQSGNCNSGHPAVSADGRFVAFQSFASGLDPNVADTNGVEDVFLRDRTLNTTVVISRSQTTPNTTPTVPSRRPVISADGRYVAFETLAYDSNTAWDVYLYDHLTGSIACVSVDPAGSPAQGEFPAISADGNFVAFSSYTTAHVAAGAGWPQLQRVYIRDLQAGITELVSVGMTGGSANGRSDYPSVSADGRFVSFTSWATDVASGATNGRGQIFRRDRISAQTVLASRSTGGVEGDGLCDNSSISGDGQRIAFESLAGNLGGSGWNATWNVFVHDCTTGTTTLVSESLQQPGFTGDGLSGNPCISHDGRHVAFYSFASDLVTNDNNGDADVFIRDLQRAMTVRASVACGGGDPNGRSDLPRFSANGQWLVFLSSASNLVSNDANGCADVFVRDMCVWPVVTYCTAGITSSFCIPGMSASGSPCVSAASGFVLACSGLEGQRFGLIFYGVSGRLAMPWGAQSSSYLCVLPPIQRTPVASTGGTAGSCDGTISIDWLAFIAANPGALGAPFVFGDVVQAQCWIRDPPAPRTTNLSDAIEFTTCQ